MRILLISSIILLVSCHSTKKQEKLSNRDVVSHTPEKSEQKDSVILQEYYDNGNTKYVIYAKDSVIDEGLTCKELHMIYYHNGNLEEIGCQGYFGPWGVPVGTWTKYDSLGHTIKKTKYYHDEKNGRVETIKFYLNGEKKEQITVGYDPHYGELDSIWSWSEYTKDGRTIDRLKNK